MKCLKDRIAALEARAGYCPKTFCKMQDGSERTFYGLAVMGPFLDGEIVSTRTDDADIAGLLKALDSTAVVEII